MSGQEPTRNTFTKGYHWLLPLFASGALKDGALRVYIALGMYVDWTTGKGAFPSVATLCAVTGMGESTVRRHLADLLRAGAIERHARFRQDGSQTSSEVWLMDEPPAREGGVPDLTPPPPTSDMGGGGPDIETPIPRAPYLEPPSAPVDEPPTQVSVSTHLSSDEPADSPAVPSSGQGKPLSVVLRRMLTDAGVSDTAMPIWETAWLAAQQAEWPDWAQVEAERFYADHLPIYLSKTREVGRKPSPGTWLDWFHRDRVRQQGYLRARLDQEARMAEDPAEREARQNKALPPDRSREFDPTGAEA